MKDNNSEIQLEELHDEVENDKLIDIHADQILWKIGQLENEIKELQGKKQDAVEFYDRRVKSVHKQIIYREQILNEYMKDYNADTDKKTANMPNGVLKLTTRTTRKFGEDSDLLKYSYSNNIPTKITEKPDKNAIIKYIKETGEVPNDYEENKETKFSYKTTNVIKPKIGEI